MLSILSYTFFQNALLGALLSSVLCACIGTYVVTRRLVDYNDAEIEEFADVLTTLKTEEVAGWVRSLQLRGINLPIELKDDVILLVGEQRELSHAS